MDLDEYKCTVLWASPILPPTAFPSSPFWTEVSVPPLYLQLLAHYTKRNPDKEATILCQYSDWSCTLLKLRFNASREPPHSGRPQSQLF